MSIDASDAAPAADDGGSGVFRDAPSNDGGSLADAATCIDPNGRPLNPGGGYYNGCVIEVCQADGDFVGEAVACSSATPDGGMPPTDAATSRCSSTDDCGGLGCVFNLPGCGVGGACLSLFAAPEAECTSDRVPYCGCDGVTFFDSSSCPMRPYAHWGECPTSR